MPSAPPPDPCAAFSGDDGVCCDQPGCVWLAVFRETPLACISEDRLCHYYGVSELPGVNVDRECQEGLVCETWSDNDKYHDCAGSESYLATRGYCVRPEHVDDND